MLSAQNLLELLLKRHTGEICIPECKDGPTMFGSHLRMDLWVMRKSWTKPWTYCYEIKTSRSDFLNDEKWQRYLPLCNQFYFVCPSGVIRPEELSAQAGLLWASKTGTRLTTKKKAPHRDVEIPESLWRYILIARTRVTRESLPQVRGREYWQRWLKQKEEDRELGHLVSKTIQETLANRVTAVRLENERIKNENDSLREVREFLDNNKIPYASVWTVRHRLERLQKILDPEDLQAIRRASTALNKVLEKVDQLEQKTKEEDRSNNG